MAFLLLERVMGWAPRPADAAAWELYKDIDEGSARAYDGGLVEFGLMSEDDFNRLYPDHPYDPEPA